MENQQEAYIAYLQKILTEKQVAYLSEAQFIKQSKKQYHNDSHQGVLKTNLKPQLSGDILSRYSRQMLLKQFQYEGQLKISNMKIALIGSGGIGCPTGLYLAGAGVGTLGLFDSDNVDMTNLHRQVGHSTLTLGMSKTASLKKTLLNLNPNISINQHPFITVETLNNLDGYDLVIDGSDNPQCRYLVNDYLMSKGKKLLSGACIGWQGQITCYGGEKAPCYRCIWGDDQKTTGGCSTVGVVGMLPGFVGMILGVQALKIILNGQSSLEQHLLTYQGRTCTFRKMKLRNRKPQCLACGQKKLNIKEYDYQKYEVCKVDTKNLPQVASITWEQYLKDYKNDKILDVRASAQYNIAHLDNSVNIPYDELCKMDENSLKQKLPNIDSLKVMCRSGINSRKATQFLLKNGIKNATNIKGGINQYGNKFDKSIPDL